MSDNTLRAALEEIVTLSPAGSLVQYQAQLLIEALASSSHADQPSKQADLPVKFTDAWDCKHAFSLTAAAEELKAFYDAWPGGLEEIESALRTARQPQAQPAPIKDHIIAQTVNELTQIAKDFHATQQLRSRIADLIVPILKAQPAAQPADPKEECDLSPELLASLDKVLGLSPQAQPALLAQDDATTDLCIELAGELEKLWAKEAIEETKAFGARMHEGPFAYGWESACEEIEARIGNGFPIGAQPAAQPSEPKGCA